MTLSVAAEVLACLRSKTEQLEPQATDRLWKSLKVRKLVFRNDPLDLLGFALDPVPYPSIGLDGHMLYDGVNR
jgi:hypothetical protein